MKAQANRLKNVATCFLILWLCAVIMAIPYIGYLISIISVGTIHVLLLTIAIVTLLFAFRASAPRAGTILVMIAIIPGIISALLMYSGMRIGSELGREITGPMHAYELMYSSEMSIFFVGFNIGVISWVCYVCATVVLFLNLVGVRRRYKNIEAGYSVSPISGKTEELIHMLDDERLERAMYPEYEADKARADGNIKKQDEKKHDDSLSHAKNEQEKSIVVKHDERKDTGSKSKASSHKKMTDKHNTIKNTRVVKKAKDRKKTSNDNRQKKE